MNNKPYTQNEFIDKMKGINPSIEILGEYTNSHSRIKVKCLKCDKEWSPKAYQLIQGHGCPNCGKQLATNNRKGKTARKTTEKFEHELSQAHKGISLVGSYVNNRIKVKLHCDKCGHEWLQFPFTALRGVGCPNCYKAQYRRYTPDSFKKKVLSINPSIELLSSFTKSTERIEVKCTKCHNVWHPKAFSLLQGRGCPKCSHKIGAINNKGATGLKSNDAFLDELSRVHPNIEALEQYSGNKKSLRFHCKRCDHTWQAKPYSVLQGHGCPRCVKSGTSFMEQFILTSFRRVLNDASVLSRNKSLIGLEIDIYVPTLRFAIEPGNWMLHKKSLKRDLAKRNLCKSNGVRLVTIYDKYPSGKKAPFSSDCIVFCGDYNKEDHRYIKSLVYELFAMAGIERLFSENEWAEIEKEAYDNSLSKTNDKFVEELSQIHPTIEALGKYINSGKRLLVRCRKCGYEWKAVPANLLSGDGCRKCGNRKAHEKFIKTQSEFVKEVAVRNPNVEVIGQYTGRHSEVAAKCKICGFKWNPVAASLLRGSSHKRAKAIHRNKKDSSC